MCAENGKRMTVEDDDGAVDGGSTGQQKNWPEDPNEGISRVWRLLSSWTYSYMNPLLDKGSKQKKLGIRLCQEDLYKAPQSMQSDVLSQKLRQNLGDGTCTKRLLLSALWKVAAPTFVPAGGAQLCTVICLTAVPLLVRGLLEVLEENPSQKVVDEGLPYVLGMFLCLVVNAFANHKQRHLAMKSGVAMRAALVNIIYEHILYLSPNGRRGLTSGEVNNLVAVDTQKIYEVTQEGHLIWALPLSVILVTILLLLTLGPSTLVGIAVLILFVPFIERITRKMLVIREKRTKQTDKRSEIVSAMLQGMRVTKLNNYEKNYERRVTETRNKEQKLLRRELAVWATTLVITVVSPILASAATFATYVLISEDNILTAADTFAVLLLFSALRFPINFAGRLIGKATQAMSALSRISTFLGREVRCNQTPVHALGEKENAELSLADGSDEPLTLSRAGFYLGVASVEQSLVKEDDTSGFAFTVSEFNFSVHRGDVVAVIGPVGAGKSTFINGIIDEVAAFPESVVTTRGKRAFVSQTPFILNATLRENILFGLRYEKEHYDRVIDACCLQQDIEQLGQFGDLTEIGERGVTLSGGQKSRVSLARAAYARPQLVLLDDPLSALDAGTAKLVFERLIERFFKSAAVVLVTHASHFLNRVDRILVLVEGKNQFLGSWAELSSVEHEDAKSQAVIEFIRSTIQEKESIVADKDAGDEVETRISNKSEKRGSLITTEEREHGLSSIYTWLLWFKYAGGAFFLCLQILFMAIDRFAYVAVEFFLARWTAGAYQSVEILGVDFPPQTDGLQAQYKYLTAYSSIILVSIIATLIRSEWAVTGGSRAAKNVFSAMLSSVLAAPMSYFETTPMGRVLNRFTFDIDVCDIVLTENMSMLMISMSWYVAGVTVMIVILPWVALAIFPVTAMYFIVMLHYRRSGADLQRLDAVSRSPIQAMVTEGLDGTSTIRVYEQDRTFVDRFGSLVDQNSSAVLNFITAQRWMGLRIELLGSLIVLVSSTLVVCLNDVLQLDSGIVGLLILWSSNFTITLGFLIDTATEAEAAITAIERVDAMAHLPSERPMVTDEAHKLPSSWPESGLLKFSDVSLRYREGLPLALNQLSFIIPPGASCGFVGRTGSGKSSSTVALFRLVEIESGQILLDGVDLASIGLSDVRGRQNGMVIIPQEPFLAGGTLREVLDPLEAKEDNDVVEALRAVRLASDDNSKILETKVEEGGSNFSVGERQLLNLARALLSQPKVLVLDEATASVDGETDAFIQQMLRTRFSKTTLVTIAHRLQTIMDYDIIVVMDAGRAVEIGSPAELLERSEGLFSQLVDATANGDALRAMVRSTNKPAS